MKKVFRKILLILTGILVGLLIGEVIVRVFLPNRLKSKMEYRHNKEGFRDLDHSLEKEPGQIRIAFLGDSYVFGQGVEFKDIFPVRLEDSINSSGGEKKVESLIFGRRGADTQSEYNLLINRVLKYQPDIIVLGFTLNDFADARMTRGYVNEVKRRTENAKILSGLESFSRLAGLLDWAFVQLFSGIKEVRLNFLNSSFREGSEGFGKMKGFLDKIGQEMSDRKGVVLFFPYFVKDEKNKFFYHRGRKIVRNMCSRHGLKFVEVMDHLQSKPYHKWWVSASDHHPNKEAHAIIANLLKDLFQKEGFLQ